MLQIQFKGMTIYDCGTTYNPKHPENNPACTVVTNLKDSLRLQVSCVSFAIICDLLQHFLAIDAAIRDSTFRSRQGSRLHALLT